jgi:hypothetical protein
LDCKSYFTGLADTPGHPVLTDLKRNKTYLYWYPNDIKTQYLYESYPSIINPIEGVTNEHFINWMRTAALPDFRKLYGRIDNKVLKGDKLVFEIQTNFEVVSFSGSKTLYVTTLADYGGRNYALGNSVIIVGVSSLIVGVMFAFKRFIRPRPLGDIRTLNWNRNM